MQIRWICLILVPCFCIDLWVYGDPRVQSPGSNWWMTVIMTLIRRCGLIQTLRNRSNTSVNMFMHDCWLNNPFDAGKPVCDSVGWADNYRCVVRREMRGQESIGIRSVRPVASINGVCVSVYKRERDWITYFFCNIEPTLWGDPLTIECLEKKRYMNVIHYYFATRMQAIVCECARLPVYYM